MIKTSEEMIHALKRSKFSGVILYEGLSKIDGSPIVVIANRITTASDNGKTGAMVQTFIIRSDMHPIDALKTGADKAVCGDCKHRPVNLGSCYVNVGQSVAAVYKAYKNNRYARPNVDYAQKLIPDLFSGAMFRIGTYGDPAAAPFHIWQKAVSKALAHNGYTHQWRKPKFQKFQTLCMASVDSLEEYGSAILKGWRTFRVRKASDPFFKEREVQCPASKEAGQKTTCADCRACGGLTAKARVGITIISHGKTASRFH